MTKKELDWADEEAARIIQLHWNGFHGKVVAVPKDDLIEALRSAHRRGMEEAAGICEGYPLDPNDGVGYFITDGIHGDWARDGETARVRRHCAEAIRAAMKEKE